MTEKKLVIKCALDTQGVQLKSLHSKREDSTYKDKRFFINK